MPEGHLKARPLPPGKETLQIKHTHRPDHFAEFSGRKARALVLEQQVERKKFVRLGIALQRQVGQPHLERVAAGSARKRRELRKYLLGMLADKWRGVVEQNFPCLESRTELVAERPGAGIGLGPGHAEFYQVLRKNVQIVFQA